LLSHDPVSVGSPNGRATSVLAVRVKPSSPTKCFVSLIVSLRSWALMNLAQS